MAQHLARHCIIPRIPDDRTLLTRLLVRLECNDSARETCREALCRLAADRLQDLDQREETVARGGDGGELGVILPNPFNTMHGNVDFLARAKLCDKDIRVGSADRVGREGVDLLAGGVEYYVTRVDRGVGVQLVRVGFGLGNAGNAFTGGGEVEDDGVVVGRVLWGVARGGFCEVLERGGGAGEKRSALMNHCILTKAFLSPTSGMRPRRCDRTSSWIMEVLVWT